MPHYRREPLTLDEVRADGPPVTLRHLAAISGLSMTTVRAEIAAGQLVAHRLHRGGYWRVARVEARRWLAALGLR
jgi:hypothetical protein